MSWHFAKNQVDGDIPLQASYLNSINGIKVNTKYFSVSKEWVW